MPKSPKSSRLLPSSQQSSDATAFASTSALALEEAIDVNNLHNNDSSIIKKRKLGVSSEDLNLIVMDFGTQRQKHDFLTDAQAVPSTPVGVGKSPRNKRTGSPLTPLSLEHPPPWEANVSSRDDLSHLMVQPTSGKLQEGREVISLEDVEESFANRVGSPTLTIEPHMNQDQFMGANTLDIVSVPGQGSRLPIPSRNRLPYDVKNCQFDYNVKQFRHEMKKPSSDQHTWSMIEQPEQRVLCNHTPDSKAIVRLQDTISDAIIAYEDSSQSKCIQSKAFLKTSRCLPTSGGFANSEDDDLQFVSYEDFDSLGDLLQTQMPEFEDWSEADPTWIIEGPKENQKSDQDLTHMQRVAGVNEAVRQTDVIPNSKVMSDGLLAESFSTISALQNYMCLKKWKNSNPQGTVSHHFPVIKPPAQGTSDKIDEREDSGESKDPESHPALPSMSKPEYILPSGRQYFVVSTRFLKNRKLACRVQRLYPGAELIERDFTLGEPARNGVQSCPDPPSNLIGSLSDEADITISSGTGIILTTLQKISQCSLPGQAVRLIARERVARVALRYEKLFVLVSEDHIRDCTANETGNAESHIVNSNYKAGIDFVGFCSTLKHDTQALFIAGKEENLAEWIVAMMVKHGGVQPGVMLIPEETTWEIFLRRAGFNTFAAQAILAELRSQSTATSTSTARDGGLTAFVKMPIEERVKRFEKMFGGSNLLKRVSSHLDARW